MLLDEPSTNMDAACRQRTVELLRELKRQGMALIIATHDLQSFVGVADRTLQLSDGRLSSEDRLLESLPEKVTPIAARVRRTV